MSDVICLGELLIDLIPLGPETPGAAPRYLQAPGGAPANVACGLSRLGLRSAFAGKVGRDFLGRFLADTLKAEGVDTEMLRYSEQVHTTLALVSLGEAGAREFLFYRNPGADTQLELSDLDQSSLVKGRIFHFGSLSLCSEPARSATYQAIRWARQAGLLISYDPNLRPALWPSEAAMRAAVLEALPLADLVKLSEEELCLLAGSPELQEALERLWQPPLRAMAVTLGPRGCLLRSPEGLLESPGFRVQALDTTGAGDAFMAGLLAGLLREKSGFASQALPGILRRANAVAALSTTRYGAIPAMPRPEELEAFLSGQPNQ